jgi:molybdopterin converting factor subunit 1
MRVRVRLFAVYREAVGCAELDWSVEDGATAGDLWQALRAAYPGLPAIRPAAAINADYARLDAPLSDGDEVAFLPPVSGGDSS